MTNPSKSLGRGQVLLLRRSVGLAHSPSCFPRERQSCAFQISVFLAGPLSGASCCAPLVCAYCVHLVFQDCMWTLAEVSSCFSSISKGRYGSDVCLVEFSPPWKSSFLGLEIVAGSPGRQAVAHRALVINWLSLRPCLHCSVGDETAFTGRPAPPATVGGAPSCGNAQNLVLRAEVEREKIDE